MRASSRPVSTFFQVPDCLKSKSLDGVELEADERSQSSKEADRGPLARMFPATYGARLLQVGESGREATCAVSSSGGCGVCVWKSRWYFILSMRDSPLF